MSSFWKRLWCLHYWIRGIEIDLQYGKGYLYPYTCNKCEKTIERWNDNDPISYVGDEL